MDIFKGQNIIEFTGRFQSDLDCKKYLAGLKWSAGYTCRKCGHRGNQERRDFSRTCNRCSDTESPGAGTLFHKVKFGLLKVFHICFEMASTTKGLSALQVSRRYELRYDTARVFMHKVREAMKSSDRHPLGGEVHVDEFVMEAKNPKGREGATGQEKEGGLRCPADKLYVQNILRR